MRALVILAADHRTSRLYETAREVVRSFGNKVVCNWKHEMFEVELSPSGTDKTDFLTDGMKMFRDHESVDEKSAHGLRATSMRFIEKWNQQAGKNELRMIIRTVRTARFLRSQMQNGCDVSGVYPNGIHGDIS